MMPLKRAYDTDKFELRSPHILTIKDLITIVSVAVSLAIAWGVFDTRITVLEREQVRLQTADVKQVADLGDIATQLKKLELRIQDDQHFIDDLYRSMKKPMPRRSDYRDYN
jgi:uncharacterized ubiquitin-like protein YukD